MSTLSAEQRKHYDDQGYLVLESGIDDATLDAAVADAERLLLGAAASERRVQDAWKTSEPIRRIALDARVSSVLHELYYRRPLPFQTLNFRVGSEQRPHADSVHFDSVPPGHMCGAWLALEDIDMDNGPLVYYPGSHKLPPVAFADLNLPPHTRYYPQYEDHVERAIEAHVGEVLEGVELERKYALLRKGELIIWSANLIHGGAPQRDPARTRHSQVTHYLFEGFRYRTPMLSGRYFTYWRYPEWITDSPKRSRARQARVVANQVKWTVFAKVARAVSSRRAPR